MSQVLLSVGSQHAINDGQSLRKSETQRQRQGFAMRTSSLARGYSTAVTDLAASRPPARIASASRRDGATDRPEQTQWDG